jgi:steroid delta-isomerase-like uncharacterized protein
MMVEANKAIVERWVAALNAGDWTIFEDVLAPGLVAHTPAPPGGMAQPGRAGLIRNLQSIFAALPGFHETLDDLVAEGDRVAWRWTLYGRHTAPLGPVPPTGRPVRITGIEIWRIQDGRVVELWNEVDVLGFMQQLGLLPTPEPVAV